MAARGLAAMTLLGHLLPELVRAGAIPAERVREAVDEALLTLETASALMKDPNAAASARAALIALIGDS
jgi:hypothetical protein